MNLLALTISLLITNGFLIAGALKYDDDHLQQLDNNQLLGVVVQTLEPYQSRIQQWPTRSPMDDEPLFTCEMCTSLVGLARQYVRFVSDKTAEDIVISACQILDLAPRDEICGPIIRAYSSQFLYIMRNKRNSDLNGTEICTLLTRDCDSAHPEMINWGVDLVGEGVDFEGVSDPDQLESVNIVQITDVHLDLRYKVGAATDCGERMPICCREEFGFPPENDDDDEDHEGAGRFGHNRCALGVVGFDALLQHVADTVESPKFILLTGDYTHSGVWQYSQEENGMHITAVVNMMVDKLGNSTPAIYPVVGNHEPHVVNLYAPTHLWNANPGFSLSWMYETTLKPLLDKYPGLLEPNEAERFMKFGYYTVSPVDGLRLIVLNTNLCYKENFWLGFEADDPEGQMEWVVGVFRNAEEAHENVLVVGHVEPGSCWGYWSGVWNSVVERYRGIIRGQFYGHAHKPHYRVAFRNATTEPISLSYVAGSALPDRMNPAYTVYQVDGDRAESTWAVLDQQLVVLKLNQSNELNEPTFDSFDVRKDLGIGSLTPAGVWDWISNKLVCNQPAVDKFLEFHHKGADSPSLQPCATTNTTCMSKLLCSLVGSNDVDDTACRHLQKIVLDRKCQSIGSTTEGSGGGGGVTLNSTSSMNVFLWYCIAVVIKQLVF